MSSTFSVSKSFMKEEQIARQISLRTTSDSTWRKDTDWKARYSKLYSSRGVTLQPDVIEPRRISFMQDNNSPYQNLVVKNQLGSVSSVSNTIIFSSTILSSRSDMYSSKGTFGQADDLGGHETMLLDMVRAQSKEREEALDKPLELPTAAEESEEESSDACIHGWPLSARCTERSVSRSRFSRVSNKRDMDIPSILAFTTSVTQPTQLEVPGFQKINTPQNEMVPRWSIRRSVCPVCSQKWKDRSAIKNIKYSGLKRSSASDYPTVIAPARLRASITMAYSPRPALAVVDEETPGYRLMRNTSTSWQLTRARKFRTPKIQMPPEANAPPPAAAPMARKDLDTRVSRFLEK